jgi:hypothetical protein
MGFQDNSGDIILDAVLTDEGRRRLARGDGSFAITKFALGDEEINYSLFDTTTATAYQDLAILQTPCLEAFTNNTSTMKTKLITLTDNNTLYLPVLKLNQNQASTQMHSDGHYVIAADANTEDNNGATTATTAIGVDSSGKIVSGVIYGSKSSVDTTVIRVDSGLDTSQISPNTPIESYAQETAYIVEMDNRLGYLVSKDGATQKSPDAVDDDNVATYSFTSNVTNGVSSVFVFNNSNTENSADQVIAGPRSTYIEFKIASAANLRQSDYLFTLLGRVDGSMAKAAGGSSTVKYIDSIIKVTGMTTGYSVDIPVRYVKL